MANAGRVAIVPKGDYSSSVTYKRLDLVRYNDKAYVAKKASTGVLPTNTDYWMLMTSDGIVIDNSLSNDSTNPVQNKIIKTAIDNIQTTSRATLSQAGWYRVAECKGVTNLHAFEIVLTRGISVDSIQLPETHTITVNCANANTIDIASNDTSGTHRLTLFRITKDSTRCYAEVYYNMDKQSTLYITLLNENRADYEWQAITPTLTSETVDGVTVTTTYDIPANASPVTDLDIAEAMNGYVYSAVNVANDTEFSNALLAFHNSVEDGAIYTRKINFKYGNSMFGDGVGIIRGYRQNANYGYQILEKRYSSSKSLMAMCYISGGTWSEWNVFATIADLANYLPKSGGDISGILGHNAYGHRLIHQIRESGNYSFWDTTKAEAVFTVPLSGTNTFNGTASGNLALESAYNQNVKAPQTTPFSVNNTTSGATTVYMGYKTGDTVQGYIGFDNGEAVVYNKGKIFHTGNSAKVVVSATAPSDTSSVWVDSANKVSKVYIDGAWTALA